MSHRRGRARAGASASIIVSGRSVTYHRTILLFLSKVYAESGSEPYQHKHHFHFCIVPNVQELLLFQHPFSSELISTLEILQS